MRLYQLAVFGGLASCVQSLQFERSIPGVVSLPFERRAVRHKYEKRAGKALNSRLGSRFFDNIVNITVGTPPQPITISLDTGSSDIILLHGESPFCAELADDICPSVGYYNANKSSTYKYMSSGFEANFGFAEQGQGSGAKGDVAADNVAIGGVSLKNQQLALAYSNSSIAVSILGLGYASAENQVHTKTPKAPYDNLPLSMAKQGATNLALFSLWNDQPGSHNGNILFGGVDKGKYSGDLVSLPVQPRDNGISAFDITLQAVKVDGDEEIKDDIKGPFNVVLDCGTSGIILSDNMTKPIYDKFGVTYHQANDSAIVDCALKDSDTTIDFKFDGVTITTPISVFVTQYSGNDFCSFAILSAGQRRGLLGHSFLSSTYTVFDITNNQISLASRNFESTKEDIEAVPKGGIKDLSGNGGSTSGSAGDTGGDSETSPPGTDNNSPNPTTTANPATSTTSKPSSASSINGNSILGICLAGLISWISMI